MSLASAQSDTTQATPAAAAGPGPTAAAGHVANQAAAAGDGPGPNPTAGPEANQATPTAAAAGADAAADAAAGPNPKQAASTTFTLDLVAALNQAAAAGNESVPTAAAAPVANQAAPAGDGPGPIAAAVPEVTQAAPVIPATAGAADLVDAVNQAASQVKGKGKGKGTKVTVRKVTKKVPKSREIIEDGDEIQIQAPKGKGKGKASKVKKQSEALDKGRTELQRLQELDKSKANIQQTVAQAFLGYASLNVVDPQDGGEGPVLVKNTINPRKLDDSHVNKLVKSMQTNGKTAFTDDHCICICVRKSMIANLGDLVVDIKQLNEGSRVVWTSAAKTMQAVVANGQHRMEANIVKSLNQHLLLQKIQKDNSLQDENKTRYLELKTAFEKEKFWGVKLFDLDLIENSSAKFQILEELVSNNTVFKADNDSQLLVILLNQLRLQAEADRQEYILAQEKRYSNHKTIIHDITVDPVLRDTLIEYYA